MTHHQFKLGTCSPERAATLQLNLQDMGVTAETPCESHVQNHTLQLPKAGAVVRDVGACEDALCLETCADIAGIPCSQLFVCLKFLTARISGKQKV